MRTPLLLAVALTAACSCCTTPAPPLPSVVGTVLGPGDFRVDPRSASHEELEAGVFEQAWRLPADAGAGSLLGELRALVAADLDLGGSTVRFGDLALRTAAGESADDLLDQLRGGDPTAYDRFGGLLEELLRTAEVYAEGWNPKADSPADGIVFAPPLRYGRDRDVPWRAAGEAQIEQAATLFAADLEAIKAAENDYRQYPRNIGASYEAIYPVEGSYVRGVDPQGAGFAAHEIYFRSDLPFPFGSYECVLHVLTRTTPDGDLVTDIYSPGEDFRYMLGRDVFLPVPTRDGAIASILCVRFFGFDLSGVPDQPKNRREAMRSSLGNLRRNAEQAFTESGRAAIPPPSSPPSYELLGRRE